LGLHLRRLEQSTTMYLMYCYRFLNLKCGCYLLECRDEGTVPLCYSHHWTTVICDAVVVVALDAAAAAVVVVAEKWAWMRMYTVPICEGDPA
jgi:hypothetical protein